MDIKKAKAMAYWRCAREAMKLMFSTLEEHNPELADRLNTININTTDYMVGNHWDKGGEE